MTVGKIHDLANSPVGVALNFLARTSSVPFERPITAQYRVAIPTVRGKSKANLRYHFGVRAGVSVQVTRASEYEADVEVALAPATYHAPPDPPCHLVSFSLEQAEGMYLNKDEAESKKGSLRSALNAMLLSGAGGTVLHTVGCVVGGLFGIPCGPPSPPVGALLALNAGLIVRECTLPGAPLPDGSESHNCEEQVRLVPTSAPPNPGSIFDNAVQLDESQPYPVYGWLDIEWL